MNDEKSARNARAEMELAKNKSEKTFATGPKQPGRYKLYDKIKGHVSLRTVDLVIAVTAALIIILLIYGILTGNRAQ